MAALCSTMLWSLSLLQVRATDTPVATAPSSPGDARVLFQNLCQSCHGDKGAGNATLMAPSIAGLPDWYVLAQLGNFQADRRGTHPSDTPGQMMRTIAKVLSPAQSHTLSRFVSQLSRVRPAALPNVDTRPGKLLFEERCMECHRYNAEGELFFSSPPLVGHAAWYLKAQLHKFRRGERGAVPGDEFGAKMVMAVVHIDSDELLDSLVAYLMEMQNPPLKAPGTFGED
ncbi:MAG: cytochrome c [Verrucomicrobium sp.]